MSLAKKAQEEARFIDDRLGSSGFLKTQLNKVFPDHWSFMLGEIALYSFIILLLTGIYLSFFFEASPAETVYNGSYVPLKGVTVTQAYASTLHISFDVRAGLVMRQIHHWSALLFVAAISVHLCRVFFTGAFRKPRELNWTIGVTLLALGIIEGFVGYSLPDDLLSGTGMRIGYSIVESIPFIGSWLGFVLFGGDYPGTEIIQRLYVAHILLIPGIILALISAHLAMVWHQKHTQFRGPGRTENNVVGSRIWPKYAANGSAYFFLVFAMTGLLGGLAQINPIWLYGPYDPANVSAASQPDWYMGWLDGSTRLFMPWEFRGAGVTLSPLFWPTIIMPGLIFTAMALYPTLEAKFTGDRRYHHLLDRPRDNPTRTAIGAASIGFYVVLWISGGNDVIASTFRISLNAMTWVGRIACIAVAPITYIFTKRICIALQKRDEELRTHGIETGLVRQLPSGEFTEVAIPLPDPAPIQLTPAEEEPGPAAGDGGRRGGTLVGRAGRAVSGFFVNRETGPPGR